MHAMKLWTALNTVQRDAEKQADYHRRQLTQKPLGGWSQEKHERYHTEHIQEAETAAHYCFIRQMQLNPD